MQIESVLPSGFANSTRIYSASEPAISALKDVRPLVAADRLVNIALCVCFTWCTDSI